ncbi:MAG: hypothetical protein IM534_09650 [Chitinophagaceae bacterium]|jgi:hypothetical protein|nr:hypothetical protein [Chitinophagaceae bacterium]MCE2973076.1 hypothetical protein [Sediminibacterium sp.]MCA6483721.1 hypothetical protein [Chitinophagaceae bacterium]MCA6484916.1 hypothetical protein [Chitinophagaceae bacterium]MCA6488113.1 hypothetical protein [Chitinophagaceae bacterium]
MKNNFNLIESISNERNHSETTLVPASVPATRTETVHPQVFGVADLWKLERSRRIRSVRRHFAL